MRPGLVALGDSITHGDVAPMLGVRSWSWAQWLASALELPYTQLAVPGATVADLPAQLARLDGPYGVGCLWVGANDCRALEFSADAFAAGVRRAAGDLIEACESVVLVTVPLDLGRPRAGEAKVRAANAAIREVADSVSAVVVDVADLRGWKLVLPDAVHLTALGELEVADRAYSALQQRGLVYFVPSADEMHQAAWLRRPSALAEPDRSVLGAARFAATGYAASLVRDWRRRGVEALGRRLRR